MPTPSDTAHPEGEMKAVFQPGSNEWWTVRRVANGDATRPWYELTDEDRAALSGSRPEGDEATIIKDCRSAISEWIGFSASVIKSGEPWTAACEDRYRKARQGLEGLSIQPWKCAARAANHGPHDPPECNWPMCGCDPEANKVIEALEEIGGPLSTPPSRPQGEEGLVGACAHNPEDCADRACREQRRCICALGEPSRFHLSEPTITLKTAVGERTFGAGWMLITEAEYAAISNQGKP